MKRFKFNLEKILELRKYREREAEIELGRAIGLLRDIENRLEELAGQWKQAVEQRFSPGYSMDLIQSYNLFILRLEKKREGLLKDAAEAELKVEEARALFLEASRDRKALDKVKEMRQREHRRAVFAAEVKTLDDISGGVTARRAAIDGA